MVWYNFVLISPRRLSAAVTPKMGELHIQAKIFLIKCNKNFFFGKYTPKNRFGRPPPPEKILATPLP